jgi:hypothetical protein
LCYDRREMSDPALPKEAANSKTGGSPYVGRFLAPVFVGVAILLSVVSVLLVRQNRVLHRKVQFVESELLLQPGTEARPITGKDLRGDSVAVAHGQDGKKTLMLVFSPDCHACDLNWPKWNLAIRSADAAGARVVGVNLAPVLTEEYIERHGLGGRVVIAQADASSKLAYQLRFTPQTIVIGSDAKVLWVWTGALPDKAEKDLDGLLSGRSASMAAQTIE